MKKRSLKLKKKKRKKSSDTILNLWDETVVPYMDQTTNMIRSSILPAVLHSVK